MPVQLEDDELQAVANAVDLAVYLFLYIGGKAERPRARWPAQYRKLALVFKRLQKALDSQTKEAPQ